MIRAKRIANIVLPLVGIALIVYYLQCSSSCSFLKGSFLHVDLKYLGLGCPAALFVLALLEWDRLFLAGVSFGMGAEINLVAFQFIHHTFCPYCLAFAAILGILFVINFTRSQKLLVGLSVLVGLVAFLLFFSGIPRPAYAADLAGIPSFGKGRIQVRLYSDYFCNACQATEPKVEPLLTDLVKRNRITLRFVDIPVHTPSPLYDRYFLYILNGNGTFESVLHSRDVLFEAAKNKIEEKDALEEYLKKQGVRYKVFDPAPCYAQYQAYWEEDGIDQTPTCVIRDGAKKSASTGEEKILKTLEGLK